MHKKIRKKFMISFVALGLIATIPFVGSSAFANDNSDIEGEFISVIEKYADEDVVVENGLFLEMGETLDLSEHPNWNLSNKNTVKIDKNGIVTPISGGTVFLSQEFDGDLHVIEIYVPEKQISTFSLVEGAQETKRDYYKVFIDPGHGGSDNGASGFGAYEDELNLQISFKVKEKLEAKGIQVKMSRTNDTFITLGDRPRLANEYGADAFVSIHQNSASTPATGIETYHHSSKSQERPLAAEIQTNALRETGAVDRKVKSADFAVLRGSYMPSSLFESGFISTESESMKLRDPAYQDKLATGIANGIENYLKNYINLDLEEIPPTAEVAKTGTVINTTSLNVRSGYGANYSAIGTLSGGQKVDIYDTQNGWHKINYKGNYGYVSGTYIKIDTPDPEPPVEPPTEPEQPKIEFKDISNHWAKTQILDFVEKGFINGYQVKDGFEFRPENSITRAEFVKLVNRVFGFTSKATINFKDVNSKEWYYDEVRMGVAAGYIDGYKEDNTFRPDAAITREEASKIVAKITNLKGDGKLEFKDNSKISDWAKEYVDALTDNKIIEGYPDGTFKPQDKIKRGESVVTLSRTK